MQTVLLMHHQLPRSTTAVIWPINVTIKIICIVVTIISSCFFNKKKI